MIIADLTPISKPQLWKTLKQFLPNFELVVGLKSEPQMGDFGRALKGNKFFYADHSYFQRGWNKRNFRLVRNGAHVTRIFPAKSDRLAKFDVKIRPWRRDGSRVVVIKPSEYLAHHFGLEGWVERTMEELKQYTDREIFLREGKEGFLECIRDAWAVVCPVSVAGVEAALDGVPVFSTPLCPSWPISAGELKDIEKPAYFERYEWANSLAWACWNTSEVGDIDYKNYQLDGPDVKDFATRGPAPAINSFKSQFDEDEHIAAVFKEIGTGSRILCDFGARLSGSNSANLLKTCGFEGTLVDSDEGNCKEIRKHFPHVKVIHKKATPFDVNEIVPKDTWFLSIDIDSFDWWMWANLVARPALVVVETNPLQGLFVSTMECGVSDRRGYGMSLDAAKLLGEAKGYDYIGRTVVNAFFVRKDLNCQYRLPDPPGHYGTRCGTELNVFA